MRLNPDFVPLPAALVVVLGTLIALTSSENVLVLIPLSPKSHTIVFDSLIDGLSSKGHTVTVITSWDRPSKKDGTERNVILPPGFDPFPTMSFKEIRRDSFLSHEQGPWLSACRRVSSAINETFSKGIENKFELILIDINLHDCLFGLLHKLRIPFIFVSTLPVDNRVEPLGSFQPFSYVPHPVLPYSQDMSFPQRAHNFVFQFVAGFNAVLSSRAVESVYREYFGEDLPGILEIAKEVSMVFSNTHFSIDGPRPRLPDVIDIGGVHCRPGKRLPTDLQNFVSSGKNGFILFSLGTIVKPHELSLERQLMFVETFRRLKYQVLWKWPNETLPGLSSNVRLTKWLPQQDLLAHPQIKLFINHGGLLSIQEAAYHGVPVISFPIFLDHPGNARRAKEAGFGESLEILDVTADSLVSLIKEVISNDKYRESAQNISKIFRDEQEPPLKKAVYWMEYVMRHKGAKHLRSPARDLSPFVHYSLDVLLLLVAVAGIVVSLLVKLLRIALQLIYKGNQGNHLSKKRN